MSASSATVTIPSRHVRFKCQIDRHVATHDRPLPGTVQGVGTLAHILQRLIENQAFLSTALSQPGHNFGLLALSVRYRTEGCARFGDNDHMTEIRATAIVGNVCVRTDKGSVDYIEGFLGRSGFSVQLKRQAMNKFKN